MLPALSVLGTLLQLLTSDPRVETTHLSEDLRKYGYLRQDGSILGDPVGPYEGFNIGGVTLNQLARTPLIPDKEYRNRLRKPDGLVIDRRSDRSRVILVSESKNVGELSTELKRNTIFKKVADEYCRQLDCEFAVVTDTVSNYWLYVDLHGPAESYQVVLREDGFNLDSPADLSSEEGRAELAHTLERLSSEFDALEAKLVPVTPVDPTRLADSTWQTLWLASGESPETCLASFIEILLFKFLSDVKLLTKREDNTRVDFDYVRTLASDVALVHYIEQVRPQIEHIFPVGEDGVGVVGGLILDAGNRDHGALFLDILRRFHRFGSLRKIDPEFKSRIFERFLKKSISQKNWGQFFTPRNVVKAMVEMSGIDRLPPGSVVADPAAGVGGFVLEPLIHKRQRDFRAPNVVPLVYKGYDRDPKTVRLAKANMLIHLSDLIEKDPINAAEALPSVLNSTFKSTHDSQIGSLRLRARDEWDLVMTNPPYVVAGTTAVRQAISRDTELDAYYDIAGAGIENLFVQEIIKGLRAPGRALIVVPDGLLLRHTEEALREFILRNCYVEAIVSLPKNTFYSTPKKTYILSLRKKASPEEAQTDPVFTFLVGAVGETLDAKRFTVPENDLQSMAQQFKIFNASPREYEAPEGSRARIFPIQDFAPEKHWLVDRWWSEAELLAVGEMRERVVVSPAELATRLRSVSDDIGDISVALEEQSDAPQPKAFVELSLGDSQYFRLSIGKRVLKEHLFNATGDRPVPLYSANVEEPFGFLESSTIEDFSMPSVLFGIDGDFKLSVKESDAIFAITDHCGRIEVLDELLDPRYLRAAILIARSEAFDRTLRPSLKRMKDLVVKVPVKDDGSFDRDAQQAIAATYDSITDALKDVASRIDSLADLEPDMSLGSEDAA